jgi:hypothetical protein
MTIAYSALIIHFEVSKDVNDTFISLKNKILRR